GGRGRRYGRPPHPGPAPSPTFVPPFLEILAPGLFRYGSTQESQPLLLQRLQDLFPVLFQLRSVSVVNYGDKALGVLVDDHSGGAFQILLLLFSKRNSGLDLVDAVEWAAKQPVPVPEFNRVSHFLITAPFKGELVERLRDE